MTLSDLAFWITPWEPSLFLPAAFAVAADLYIRDSGSPRPSPLRQAGFWTGLALLYISLLTGFEYFAEHVFFLHRLQHVVLHHLAPLLIVLSRPGEVFGRTFAKIRLPVMDALNGAVVAPLLFTGLTVIWLIPVIQQATMLNLWLYRTMNVMLVVNGLMFWHACLFGPWPVPVRIVMAAAIIPGQVVGGLLLVFAGHDLYPVFALCGRALSLSPLADQAIGGAILWLSGAMMSLPVIAILARKLISQIGPAAVESLSDVRSA